MEKTQSYINFTLLISSIYRNITRLKEREMSALGLKGMHVTCIYYLYSTDATTAAEIVKLSGEDKAAVSRSIDELQRSGLIEQDTAGYRHTLTLTESGIRLAEVIAAKVNSFVSGISGGLSDKERNALYSALSKVDGELNKCIKGAK